MPPALCDTQSNASAMTTPAPGQVVRCRTRTWFVESVEPSPHSAKVALAYIDDDALWFVED